MVKRCSGALAILQAALLVGWASAESCRGHEPARPAAPASHPASSRRHSYLPDFAARAKPELLLPKNALAFYDRSVTEDSVAELFKTINKAYPDINFSAEWDDDTVNAFAWMDGKTRRVMIAGGMLRHQYMQLEGIALVLAHETGHHFGGAPKFPGSDLSCEGQADYWATLTGLRKIFPGAKSDTDGDKFKDVVNKGIQQSYRLLTNGLAYNYTTDEARAHAFFAASSCDHPLPDCRRETYIAGYEKKPKPPCAGDSPGALFTAPGGQASPVVLPFSKVTTLRKLQGAGSGGGSGGSGGSGHGGSH